MLWYGVTGSLLTGVALQTSPASPQPSNTPITLTAVATGGAIVVYQFWLYNPTATPAWSRLQAYSASATCSWTPSAPGNYFLSASAEDGVTGAEKSSTLWYTVDTPLTAVSLTTSPTSPQMTNTPVTLTAAATGGASVQYQFWVYNPNATPAWSQLQGYSSSATCTWTPSAPGNYLLSSSARDGVTGTEKSSTLWYAVDTTLTAVSLTTSPTSPQMTNTPITLTAAATGGSNVQYQFWLYNPTATPAWSQLQGYSSSATCTWTPSAPGNYLLSTTAQDGVTGTEKSSTLWYAMDTPLTAVSLTSAPTSPQPSNTPITLTAAATGGSNVQYQFWLYNPTATPAWSQLQAYSSSTTCPWKPSTPGNYLLSTTAQDGVTGTEKSSTLWYAVDTTLTAVSLTTSPTSPQMTNTPVTLTAAATGGSNVEYQFWLYTPGATPAWSELQGFSASATCTWTPSAPGNYLLSTTAQDGVIGVQVSNMLWYGVTDSLLTAVSLATSPASPQPCNTTITLTDSATGGTNVLYQFWLYNPGAIPAWSPLQAYSASATCSWTPSAPGNYLLSTSARDGVTGQEVSMMQLVWRDRRFPADRGEHDRLAELAASGQHSDCPQRDCDGRGKRAISILAV